MTSIRIEIRLLPDSMLIIGAGTNNDPQNITGYDTGKGRGCSHIVVIDWDNISAGESRWDGAWFWESRQMVHPLAVSDSAIVRGFIGEGLD